METSNGLYADGLPNVQNRFQAGLCGVQCWFVCGKQNLRLVWMGCGELANRLAAVQHPANKRGVGRAVIHDPHD